LKEGFSGGQEDVEALGEFVLGEAEGLAKEAFVVVSDDGVAQAFWDGQAKAAEGQVVGSGVEDEAFIGDGEPMLEDPLEIALVFDPVGRGQGVTDFVGFFFGCHGREIFAEIGGKSQGKA